MAHVSCSDNYLWNSCEQTLRSVLDQGYRLRTPDGILINGQGPLGTTFTVEKGTSRGTWNWTMQDFGPSLSDRQMITYT